MREDYPAQIERCRLEAEVPPPYVIQQLVTIDLAAVGVLAPECETRGGRLGNKKIGAALRMIS
jgi:hypothetical protein